MTTIVVFDRVGRLVSGWGAWSEIGQTGNSGHFNVELALDDLAKLAIKINKTVREVSVDEFVASLKLKYHGDYARHLDGRAEEVSR